MKKSQKDLALARINILVSNALKSARTDMALAQRQASLAKRMGMKYRVRLPYEIRQLYCKKCKRLIVPGINSRIRIGSASVRAVRITCLSCGHVYRKIIPKPK